MSERTDPCAVHNVGVRLGAAVEYVVDDAEALARDIDKAYPEANMGADRVSDAGDADIDALLRSTGEADLLTTAGKGPIVQLVDAVLFEALGRRASDVHIQPTGNGAAVRYRVDGVLHTARTLPAVVVDGVVSRVKVMGRMDIAERRLPQDGRATVTIGTGEAARRIDLRISSLPGSHGERVVVRLLETSVDRLPLTFKALGMPDDVREEYLQRAGRSHGIILVTGPTGSGKSTTLYTTLRWLAQRGGGDLNVMSIEDPIEYDLSSAGVAVSQAQVNTKKGITFASGLRHILRQDPDVIMVGEIRDAETARVAVQASLTGHLVFSTLHTNDAASAVTRLVDLGVEAYLISASLSCVLAQRLVRTVHAPCAGAGCAGCLGSGFSGRRGLFELLGVSDELRDMITTGASAKRLREAAIAGGMRTLEDEGRALVEVGVTTPDDVARVAWGIE